MKEHEIIVKLGCLFSSNICMLCIFFIELHKISKQAATYIGRSISVVRGLGEFWLADDTICIKESNKTTLEHYIHTLPSFKPWIQMKESWLSGTFLVKVHN